MSTGAVIFAFNNQSLDYVKMAAWSAHNIRRHLGIPVCVITDEHDIPDDFDRVIRLQRTHTDSQRYFQDLDQSVTWYNHDRIHAYDLSPWDETLVLDADYVVASDRLKQLLDQCPEFLCHSQAINIDGTDSTDLQSFGAHKMPMHWATVMLFRRCNLAKDVFDMMTMVRDHWNHYRSIYSIRRRTYRNDFALSIALNVVSGHTLDLPNIPWPLISVMPHHALREIDQDSYQVQWHDTDQRERRVELNGVDFHAMNKSYLGEIVANQI